MNFYMRVAKKEDIKKFMADRRLSFLGMPQYISSGIHDKSSAESNKRNKESNQTTAAKRKGPTLQYRFLVMQRFGDQLEDWVKEKKLDTNKATDVAIKMIGLFPKRVLSIVLSLFVVFIDVLEYIHSFGYIHGDIKGTNILKSLSKTGNDWYLVDFGLAEKYTSPDGQHREEKPDKKRANNGTVEYRSRDAHVGQLSRRSDVECLAYNLIVWLNGTLPWMSALKDPNRVHKLKEDFFEDLDTSLKKCFHNSVPKGLIKFFERVDDLGFESKPNYSLLKDCLKNVTSSPAAKSPQKSPMKSLPKSPAKGVLKSAAKTPPPKREAKSPPPKRAAKSPPPKRSAKSPVNSPTRRSTRTSNKRYVEYNLDSDDDYEEDDSVIILN